MGSFQTAPTGKKELHPTSTQYLFVVSMETVGQGLPLISPIDHTDKASAGSPIG